MKRTLAIALLALSPALAACGGGSDAAGDDPSPTAPPASTTPVTTPGAEESCVADSTAPTPQETAGEASGGSFTVALPAAWRAGTPNRVSDMFLRSEADPAVQLAVSSGPTASGDAQGYTERQRAIFEGYGNVSALDAVSELPYEVGGASPVSFDACFEVTGSDGEPVELVERRVVLVHEGTLYDVKFQAPRAAADEAMAALETVLRSWRFTA